MEIKNKKKINMDKIWDFLPVILLVGAILWSVYGRHSREVREKEPEPKDMIIISIYDNKMVEIDDFHHTETFFVSNISKFKQKVFKLKGDMNENK